MNVNATVTIDHEAMVGTLTISGSVNASVINNGAITTIDGNGNAQVTGTGTVVNQNDKTVAFKAIQEAKKTGNWGKITVDTFDTAGIIGVTEKNLFAVKDLLFGLPEGADTSDSQKITSFVSQIAVVADSTELQNALDNTDATYVYFANSISTSKQIIASKSPKEIHGGGYTLSAVEGMTYTDPNKSVFTILSSDQVAIIDLTIDAKEANVDAKIEEGNLWDGVYALQAYNSKEVILGNVILKNGDAGLLVNGSTVTAVNITTSDNQFGGIEVSKGKNVESSTKLIVEGTSKHINETVHIWTSNNEATVEDTGNQYKYGNDIRDNKAGYVNYILSTENREVPYTEVNDTEESTLALQAIQEAQKTHNWDNITVATFDTAGVIGVNSDNLNSVIQLINFYSPRVDTSVSETISTAVALSGLTNTNGIPSFNSGETFEIDQIEVTLNDIEYVSDGFKVFLNVTNKSNIPLNSAGSLRFKIEETQYEIELNNKGYGHYFDRDGYIYEGESVSGYYQWYFDREVTINEIEYYSNFSNGTSYKPLAKWTIN